MRKSHEVRYVTWIENGPAGESIGSNTWLSTTSSWPVNSGAVRLSRRDEASRLGSEDMRYLNLGVWWDDLDAKSFLPIFQTGNSLTDVYSDRNSMILFLYVRGRSVPRFCGKSRVALEPNCMTHLSTITSGLEPSVFPPEEPGDELKASSTSHFLPFSSMKTRLWLCVRSSASM